ncbi:MAG: tetratricopeptide repeat protein [Rhodospirillaceae bacterium]|nr:tetratricopeptide repeat protein [Rhodospirillaceae bacterium]
MSASDFDIAVQHYQSGDRAAAAAAARALIAADPAHADALNLLAILAQDAHNWSEAETHIRKALALAPANPIYLNTLGNVLIAQGRTDEAVAALTAALAAAPGEPDILFNLGNAEREAGRYEQASAAYRRAIELRPGHLGAYNNLALVLRAAGDPESALAVLIEAVAHAPKSAELRFNLGNAMQAVGRNDTAEAAYRKALELNPGHVEALVNLGHVLTVLGRKPEAEKVLRQAIALDPALSQAYVGLADLVDDGAGDAVAHRRAVLAMKPDLAAVRSSLLMCLQYDPHVSRAEIAREHRAYGAIFDTKAPPAHLTKPRDMTPERPLKLGVVSGDFRFHAMAFFALPAFAARDTTAWHLTCYSTTARPDGVTAEFRAAADRWRDARHLDTASLTRLIVDDGIDVLIDLSGHAPNNRLPVFAAKPAPLQAAWGDYVDTRGLKAIDVLLADKVHVTPADEPHYVERIVRLPGDYICYRSPAYLPPVAPAPCLTNGHVTFGCFSETTKINPSTLMMWARVLAAVPDSKLVVNNRLFADGARAGKLLSMAMDAGIATDRLVVMTGGDHAQFLAQYALVDVVLDTWPYSGGLTTCEALVMGVPVLTVPGDRFCGRHAAAHLMHGGYPDGICASIDVMVTKANSLAANPSALAALRAGLRDKVLASPLCDVSKFAEGYYGALRSEWRVLCTRDK